MQESFVPIGLCRYKNPMLQRRNIAITAAMFWLWLFCSSVGLAADSEKPQEDVFVNPLEVTTPDPLLPRPDVDRRLSPLERLYLITALDELNQQAQASLQAGDRVAAFEIWNRELRLRRVVGFQEEVEALGRVGAIAWSENQRIEVQVISQRLETIQQQLQFQPSIDIRLLQSLGQAYQQVRAPQQAVEVYEQILAAAQRRQDPVAIEETLKTIAELHLSWFDYPKAATTYEELLGLARAKGNSDNQAIYLQQLNYIYERARQYKQALAIKQQLATLYLNEKDFTKVPALRLEIGSDHELLNQLEQAFQNYQEAYSSAWSLQQYHLAGDALRKLVALYRTQGQINEALEASKILLEAEQLAINYYEVMNTYDQIGQIHMERGNYPEALAAFQKGLELAQQLKHQEAHFTQQISQANQRIPK